MYGALDGLGFNADSLRRNHFCIGVKRGNEYQCGGDANEDAKSKAVELLIEAVIRILRWKVWDVWWVKEIMNEWLSARERLVTRLRGKYSEEVVNDLLGMVNKFISYNEDFWRYWQTVGSDVKELINDLMSGGTEVVIRGEDASGIGVHGEHITLNAQRARTGGITVHLVLEGLGGTTIKMPNIFRMVMSGEEYRRLIKILRALRGGFEETDGFVNEGKAGMCTNQTWQVIAWTLLYFGEAHMYINSINVNEGGVTISWYLQSSHKSIKGKLLNDVNKLSEKELLAFMLGAVLGDGSPYF